MGVPFGFEMDSGFLSDSNRGTVLAAMPYRGQAAIYLLWTPNAAQMANTNVNIEQMNSEVLGTPLPSTRLLLPPS